MIKAKIILCTADSINHPYYQLFKHICLEQQIHTEDSIDVASVMKLSRGKCNPAYGVILVINDEVATSGSYLYKILEKHGLLLA